MVKIYRDSVLVQSFSSIYEAAWVILNTFAVLDNAARFRVYVDHPEQREIKVFAIKDFLDAVFDDCSFRYLAMIKGSKNGR